jgi:methylmalonyl-CoA/ethylmalonyl-CoA epimerase
VQPTSDDSFLTRFLKQRGPGLHHVTFQVEDVEKAAEILRRRGPARRGHGCPCRSRIHSRIE